MAEINYNPCFGCGAENPRGLHLQFERDPTQKRVHAKVRIGPEYQGAIGFVHGGIIATVLDEVMSKVSGFSGVHTVTAELNIEYLKPVRVGEDLDVEGYSVGREGRELRHVGEIRNAEGVVLARGRGRFVVIDPARYGRPAVEEEAAKQI